MNDVPSQQTIEDIAIDMGTKTAYIEKDWFAIQLLKHIFDYRSDFDLNIIFTGGTCLSKGYGLIDRFSEDLDFLVVDKSESNRNDRSNFKNSFIEHVISLTRFSLKKESIESFNKNNSFKFLVTYPKIFQSDSLRDDLKIELKFLSPNLSLQTRPVKSFVAEHQRSSEEIMALCVSPIEIAGDKLSALTWRILNKKYKPQIMRHLHDLAWLKECIDESPDKFKKSAENSFKNDQDQRGAEVSQMSLCQRINNTLELLEGKSGYRDDYNNYVLEMSYSKDVDRISYESAVKIFKEICKIITK